MSDARNARTEADEDLRAALDTVNELDLRPFDPDAPGTFSGIGESFRSLLRPAAGTGQVLMMAGAPLPMVIDAAGRLGDRIGERMLSEDERQLREELGLDAPRRGAETRAQDWYFEHVVDDLGGQAIEAWTPDPAVMGSVARTMSTANTVVGSVPFLFGTPGLFVATSGADPAIDLVRQGVDPWTAGAVGTVHVAANALGMRIPAAWGSTLTQRLTTGVGSNVAIGAATDAGSAATLRARGYAEQAEGFEVLNAQARGLDVLMGALFGVRAHADSPQPTATQRDAVLVAANADHLRRASMPGDPVSAGADVRHQEAMSVAVRGLLSGESADVSGIVRPEDFRLRPELRPAPAVDGLPLRGGNEPDAVQADYAAIGERHGFRTTSTTRSRAENERVGGVENSQHLDSRGTARDWSVKGKTQEQIDAFVADLRAAGFEVITRPHGTGPHIHAELPRGGRKQAAPAPRAANDAAPAGGGHMPGRLGAATAPQPRPTLDALRSGADAFAEPPPRATVDEFAAWLTGYQRRRAQAAPAAAAAEAPAARGAPPEAPAADAAAQRAEGVREGAPAAGFDPGSDVIRMAHDLWTRRASAGDAPIKLGEEGATVVVPSIKGEALVRRTATVVDGELVAQVGMRYEALRDTGFGYFEPEGRRFGSPQEAAQASRAARPAGPVSPSSVGEPGAGIAATVRAVARATERGPSRAAEPAVRPAGEADAVGILQAARDILHAQPDLRIPTGDVDADGNPVTVRAGDLLARAEQDMAAARLDGDALTAAANCFLRFGA